MEETPAAASEQLSCSNCGATGRQEEGWWIRPDKDQTVVLCPNCKMQVDQELAQQSQDVNMGRAAVFGALAAAIGAGVWYGLVVLTDYKLGIVAIGVGWLVGKGVVVGAGNKRSVSLMVVGGVLSVLALVAGEYFIVNHMVRQYVEGFTGWLSLEEFLNIYPEVLAEGNWLLDVVFYLIALYEGVIQAKPVKLD